MTREPIPEDLKRFILTSIASVPHLEAILLLRGRPESFWTDRDVADRLYIAEKAASKLLSELHESGMLTATEQSAPTYRYDPNTEELRDILNRVAESYASNLLEVTNLIHSKIDRKAHQFADAFRWRKDS